MKYAARTCYVGGGLYIRPRGAVQLKEPGGQHLDALLIRFDRCIESKNLAGAVAALDLLSKDYPFEYRRQSKVFALVCQMTGMDAQSIIPAECVQKYPSVFLLLKENFGEGNTPEWDGALAPEMERRRAQLEEWGFPAEKYPKLAVSLAAQWEDVLRLNEIVFPYEKKLFFRYAIAAAQDIILEHGLADLVRIARAADREDISDLFKNGIPSCRKYLEKYGMEDLLEVVEHTKKQNVRTTIKHGLPVSEKNVSEHGLIETGESLNKVAEMLPPNGHPMSKEDVRTLYKYGFSACKGRLDAGEDVVLTGQDIIQIAGSSDPVYFHNILKYSLTKCTGIIDAHGLHELVNISRQANPKHIPVIIGRGLTSCESEIASFGLAAVGQDLVRVFEGKTPLQVKGILNNVLFESHGATGHEGKAYLNDLHGFFCGLISNHSPTFARALIMGMPGAGAQSISGMRKLEARANEYWEFFGESQFTYKIVSEGLGKLPPLGGKTAYRLPFEKTGSELVPLVGGNLTGYLFRIISNESYLAWKHAFDSGIPCEEIIRSYRRNDGSVAVVTKYSGERLDYFIREYPKLDARMRENKARLEEEMIKDGIFHGHTHFGNFCVEMAGDKMPIMRVIDFDQAKLIET